MWLEVALALVESLPTEDLAQQQQQQSLVVQQAQQHFAPAARLPVPPLPAAPVPAAVSAPVPLATLTAAAGAAGRATAVEVEAAVEAEPAELEAADAAALAAAAAAADAEDYDTWRTAFSTRLIRQMHLLVLCLYIAITARSWSRRGDLQPASATAATAGAIAATAGATAAGAAAGAAAGEDTVWSWLQLLRDLAPSLVAVAPVLAPAAAWPVLRRRPDGGGAPWRALVRRCMAARHVAHLAAGVAVGWLAAAPRLPAVNDYHLGPAVFLGDGVMYLGTALVGGGVTVGGWVVAWWVGPCVVGRGDLCGGLVRQSEWSPMGMRPGVWWCLAWRAVMTRPPCLSPADWPRAPRRCRCRPRRCWRCCVCRCTCVCGRLWEPPLRPPTPGYARRWCPASRSPPMPHCTCSWRRCTAAAGCAVSRTSGEHGAGAAGEAGTGSDNGRSGRR